MEAHTIDLKLTREEAQELFSRCLRCNEDDNESSASALCKLAHVLQAAAYVEAS